MRQGRDCGQGQPVREGTGKRGVNGKFMAGRDGEQRDGMGGETP